MEKMNFTIPKLGKLIFAMGLLLFGWQVNSFAQASCAAPGPAAATNANTAIPQGTANGIGGGAGSFDALWFEYTPASDGTVTIASCNGGFDTRVWLHNDCVGGSFAGNDDSCPTGPGGSNFASSVSGSVLCNTPVLIEWDDRWSANTGDWTIEFECVNPVNITSSMETQTTATVSWDLEDANGAPVPGCGVTYSLEYGPAPLTPGTGTNISGMAMPSADLTGLTVDTDYDIIVTSFCEDGFGNIVPGSVALGAFSTTAACAVVAPMAITVSTDAGSCDAAVTVVATSSGASCVAGTEANDFNAGGFDASGTYPVGTTTVTFTIDDGGAGVSATVDVTVEDNEAPVVDCTNINGARDADAGVCSFTMPGTGFDPASFGDNCMGTVLTNDFNGGASLAGETFPVGTTTVVWTATDAAGNTATCSVDIVISDAEAPVLTCPSDMTINLDPGACDAVVSYSVSATDNCPVFGPAVSLTLNDDVSAAAINNSVACPGGGYQYLVVHDYPALGVTQDIGISSVDFGIFQIFGTVDLTVNVYSIASAPGAADNFAYSDLTLITSGTQSFGPSGTAIGNIPMTGTIPAGTVVVLELVMPNGSFTNGFVPGLADGTDGTWLASNFCGLADPTVLASIGFAGQMVFQLNGNLPAEPSQTAGLASGEAFPIGTTTNTYQLTDASGTTTTCSWSVTVNEFVPSTTDISCIGLVNVSLDENCQSIVGADQILTGNDYGCFDNYPVTYASGPLQGQPVTLGPGNIGQTIDVMVTNPSGNPCWGQILVEDKLIPDLVCSDVEVGCADDTAPGAGFTATPAVAFPSIASSDNNTVNETVDVAGLDAIEDLNVTITSDHTWVGDLVISVTSPAGTTVEVMNNIGGPGFGCAGNGLDIVLDDQATATYTDLDNTCNNNPAAAGTFQPLNALSAFNGEDASGTWTVGVEDLAGGDGGNVDVTLNLTAASSIPFPVDASATVIPAGPNTFTVIGHDPCGPATLVYSDSEGGDLCAGTQAITRSWTITDGYNNTASCTQTISITPATLDAITLPADVTLECGQDYNDPALVGEPSGEGCSNIDYSNPTDIVIDLCGGGKKVLRSRTVVDWCTNTTMEHTQLIKVIDTVDPVLTCPADLTVSTTNNSCFANVALVMPTAVDCGGGVTYEVSATEGTVNGNLLVGLPLGVHTVTFTATDDCGNSATCTQKITVEDLVSPTAVCDEHTVVSLGSDGTALVNATTFDDGSNDNCGIVGMHAQRITNPNFINPSLYAETVSFSCSDVGNDVMVAFRVTDAGGLTSVCMVLVEVQDKMAPIIACKPDIDVNCDNPILDAITVGQPLPASAIALTGEPAVADNCNATLSSNVFAMNIDDCGNGQIRVLWTALDGGGLFDNCEQRINVSDMNPFDGNSIVWPLDYEANTCGLGLEPGDLPSPYSYPTWNDGTCSNVASTHEDQVLDFGADDACLKVLRKWIVIDWCTVPNGADPTNPATPGVFHYTQVIKVVNSTDPVIETFTSSNASNGSNGVGGNFTFDNFDPNCGNVFVSFDLTASDDCTSQANLEYSWAFSTGTTGTGTSATGQFANGSYSVTFTVADQCGNSSSMSRTFTVADTKKPTPVCIFGIASTVMPSAQQVTIWASDFESGSSYDNCTQYNNLIFSFSPVVPGQPIDDNLVITCADVPADGLVPVTLYVTDAAGNYDFCTTFINVQDPTGACPGPNSIFGSVQTEFQEDVEEVTITVNDGNTPMLTPVVTLSDGQFSMNASASMSNNTYNVVAEKDINYLNGVTTYDLVLISKHILGIELLDSPYKVIAADANASETVTALDIVKLRALILHIDDELAANTSWRFVDADYTFNNPNNPLLENFPEFVATVPSDLVPSNFIGVKIGDVNGTASPNSLLGTDTRTMDGKLALQAKAATVAAGETFTIDITAKDFNNIAGYQFTLGFDNSAVEFVDVTTNLEGLGVNNFGLTKVGEGMITTSWNSNQGVSVENNEVLFSVTFAANTSVNTQDVIGINSRYTASEAYSGNDLLDVVLEFNGNETASGFELYQNTPNPFKAETLIGFNMPEAGEVTLKVFDVSGRILRLVEMDAVKGYNSVDLNRTGIDATGVLYYQLETATETATKKMIIVD